MSVVQEQAKLELGKDYPQALDEAQRFVRWLLARHLFKANPLAGEGGFQGMVDTCLAYTVWRESSTEGIKEYFRVLAQEYDSKVDAVPYEVLPENTILLTKEGDEVEASLEGLAEASSPSGGDSPLTGRTRHCIRTEEEYELFSTLASIGGGAGRHGGGQVGGGLSEAASFIGIPLSAARRTYDRVRTRARRLSPSAYTGCDP